MKTRTNRRNFLKGTALVGGALITGTAKAEKPTAESIAFVFRAAACLVLDS